MFVVIFVFGGNAFALTDAELIEIRDGFDARRDGMLDKEVVKPFPDLSGSWGKMNFGTSRFA